MVLVELDKQLLKWFSKAILQSVHFLDLFKSSWSLNGFLLFSSGGKGKRQRRLSFGTIFGTLTVSCIWQSASDIPQLFKGNGFLTNGATITLQRAPVAEVLVYISNQIKLMNTKIYGACTFAVLRASYVKIFLWHFSIYLYNLLLKLTCSI